MIHEALVGRLPALQGESQAYFIMSVSATSPSRHYSWVSLMQMHSCLAVNKLAIADQKEALNL